jgi:hypothetical protein
VIVPTGMQYIVVYVGGVMAVNHGSSNGLLTKLNNIIDPVMKDGCVMKVDLVAINQLPPPPSPSPTPTPGSAPMAPVDGLPGFEWTSCDYPAHPCDDGTCCTSVVPGPGANTNANTSKTP